MTPELKTACEVVFQEHKASAYPINWNKDAFRGRLSIGLSEMAKETLVTKKIIYLPNPAKKIITVINPDVATATNFEEAVEMAQCKAPSLAIANPVKERAVSFIHSPAGSFSNSLADIYSLKIPGNADAISPVVNIKWYLKPLFYYFIWPACAAAAGALITWFIDFAYTEFFL